MAGLRRFVLVSGEAGHRREQAARRAARSLVQRAGFDAMRARCFAARGRLALAPVSEWLRSPALRSARDRLEPVWAREVDRLVPPAGADPDGRSRARWPTPGSGTGSSRAWPGRCCPPAGPPCSLLDDLQWCDEHTLAWLQLLLHLGKGHPLLVVAATRPEEVEGNAELTEMLRALRSAGQVTDVVLAAAGRRRSPSWPARSADVRLAAEAAWLHAATGGYPLLVIESVRARCWTALTPPTHGPSQVRVRAVLAGRIAQAGPAAREVAELAAVIGRDFTLELVTRAADLDRDAVIGAVDELWRRRIIREHSPASYDFFHDLLRDTAYAGISPPRRVLLHRRVAEALELTHADDPGVPPRPRPTTTRGRPRRPARCRITYAPPRSPPACSPTRRPSATTGAPSSCCGRPRGPRRDASELAIRAAMAAPLNATVQLRLAEVQAVLERTRDLAEQRATPGCS